MAGLTTGSTALRLAVDGNLVSGNGGIFIYSSTDSGADISGSTGYFRNCGVGSRIGLQVGMRLGDIVCNVESAGGVTPGRVSWHSAISSTANASTVSSTFGYDVSVSAAATS